MRILTIIPVMVFLGLSLHSVAQYESGRITTIGFGAGDSRHAGSYVVDESFRTKKFSGFRSLIVEAKVGWNFWESTSIYGVGRFSLPNSIISPYRSTFSGVGASQTIPGVNRIYVLGNYGYYDSSIGDGIKVGSGDLLNFGIGIKLSDNLFLELNKTIGTLGEIDESVDISSDMSFVFGIISYSF
jgi:hypothetical protein